MAICEQVIFGHDLRVTQFVNATGGPPGGPHRCPCCGFMTLTERSAYEICAVCFWEDDGQDDRDADEVRGGPNGGLSLAKARENYLSLGACDQRCTQFVRPPRASEQPRGS
jgi:Cysteine-rich CPCC